MNAFADPVDKLRSELNVCQRSTQRLKKSERKFRDIFQVSANLISIMTLKEGRFVEVNDSFLKLTGYAREELIGKTPRLLGVFEDRMRRRELLRRLRATGRLQNEETTFRTKQGETRVAVLSARLMEIDGKVCIVSFIQDINELKEVERALRESVALTGDRSFHA